MAASDPHQHTNRPPHGEQAVASMPGALRERLREEIGRAERHGTGLSCLLVLIENLDEVAREHGDELREETIEYVASALRRELRCFDRVGRFSERELLMILPGADSPRGEIAARRTLERLRAIKVEAAGARRALHVSVGLAAWRTDTSVEALLEHARAALRSVNGENGQASSAAAETEAPRPAERPGPQSSAGRAPAVERAGGQ